MKATVQYFHVVLFVMLYKVVLTFESVAESIKLKLLSISFLLCCLLCCSSNVLCGRWVILFLTALFFIISY